MPPRTLDVPYGLNGHRLAQPSSSANKKESSSEGDDDSDDSGGDNSGSSSDEESQSESSSGSEEAEPSAISSALAEARSEHALNEAAEQRAASWTRYTEPDAIWEALDSGNVRLLKLSYLVAKAKAGAILQRRQDLPEHAFATPMLLRGVLADASPLLSSFDCVLPIVAVSACWLTQSHPDPRGEQLRLIGQALERHARKYRAEVAGGKGFHEMGVFWDFGSLPQVEESGEFQGRRRPNEQIQFDSALRDMDLWFGHMGTVALLMTRPPTPTATAAKGANGKAAVGGRIPKKQLRKASRTYDGSGWTTYEGTSAALKQFFRMPRRMQGASWQLVVDCGQEAELSAAAGGAAAGGAAREVAAAALVPSGSEWRFELTAADFSTRLSKKSFAAEADRALCVRLYDTQVTATLGGLRTFSLQFPLPADAPPLPRAGPPQATLLGRLINRRLCGRLLELQLVRVPGLGDAFGAFCKALAEVGSTTGPLPSLLSRLGLDGNHIGDAGAKALADAARSGALRALEHLSLSSNSIGRVGVQALASAATVATVAVAASGADSSLAKLAELNLYDNKLGADGCAALSDELGRGALASLRRLFLGANAIGTEGCKRFAACLLLDEDGDGSGALPELRTLHLYRNGIGKDGIVQLGKALHGWGLHRVTEIVLDGNDLDHRPKQFVLDALSRRAWARVVLHQWQQAIHQVHKAEMARYGSRLLHTEFTDAHAKNAEQRNSPRGRRRGSARDSAVKALAVWHVESAATVL